MNILSKAALAATLVLQLSAPAAASAQTRAPPYLGAAERPAVKTWMPPSPSGGSLEDRFDNDTFFATRKLVGQARGALAHDDDVYLPEALAPRFASALGFTPTPETSPKLLALMLRVERDVELTTDPVKQDSPKGRVRPFVAHPGQPACPLTRADLQFHLPDTGSFPSVHSALGMVFALIFTELEPSRGDALAARGLDFGFSRIVCGFHYPSDVNAGRVAGAVVFARLMQNTAFRADLDAVRTEYRAAKGKGG